MSNVPVGLYIHIPWCIRKCPYCDFNSHQQQDDLPEEDYLEALARDAIKETSRFAGRSISSVFIGGGTPSLLSGSAVEQLLNMIRARFSLLPDCEITLEANPGAIDRNSFAQYANAGVNRISLGAQSFNEESLTKLGRVHKVADIDQAVNAITSAGIKRWNIDLMHGLPGQTVDMAMSDLRRALEFGPQHVSWYQLTIETNTAFYSAPPELPDEDLLADIQEHGHQLLTRSGLQQYEVSAYATNQQQSQHNMNYWQFGDYAALGAGAHGKCTNTLDGGLEVTRHWRTRQPDAFIKAMDSEAGHRVVEGDELLFEFMLNALRLSQGFELQLLEQRTGIKLEHIQHKLEPLYQRDLLELADGRIRATALGQRYLNDLVSEFI